MNTPGERFNSERRPDRVRPDIDQILRDRPQVDRALWLGVREALRVHKALGHSVVEWRDGRVVLVPPESIEIGEDVA